MECEQRERQAAYRRRKRMGCVLVTVEVAPEAMRALRGLELLAPGAEAKAEVAEAVQRFLACAPAIAAIPRSLYGE